jgi:hypothetical protein
MKTETFKRSEDIKYRRIYGGISWPGKRPGFIVIVGELKQPRAHKFVLLDESEDFDVQELIKVAEALDFYFKPERWFTNTENKGAMRLVAEANATSDDTRIGSRQLLLLPSRLRQLRSEVFTYLYPRLKRMVGEGGSLDISRGPKVLGYMADPQEQDIQSITWGEYPSIEALAFCVFELDAAGATRQKFDQVFNEYKRY